MSALDPSKIYIGTSGWSYDDWVGPFYPEGTASRDYLGEYSRRFRAVEIDASFYAIPAAGTFRGWAERTPPGFLFAPKVPGIVTHGAEGGRASVEKVLRDEGSRLEVFLERAALLGDKLAVVLFQFPYFRVKELAAGEFLARLEPVLERTSRLLPSSARVAVEIRNKGWMSPEYFEVLSRHRAASVLLDHPYMPQPEEQLPKGAPSSDIAYARLLGDRYAIEQKTTKWGETVEDKSSRIERWAEALKQLMARAELRGIFVFSNNHFAGHAPATSRELAARLGSPVETWPRSNQVDHAIE